MKRRILGGVPYSGSGNVPYVPVGAVVALTGGSVVDVIVKRTVLPGTHGGVVDETAVLVQFISQSNMLTSSQV